MYGVVSFGAAAPCDVRSKHVTFSAGGGVVGTPGGVVGTPVGAPVGAPVGTPGGVDVGTPGGVDVGVPGGTDVGEPGGVFVGGGATLHDSPGAAGGAPASSHPRSAARSAGRSRASVLGGIGFASFTSRALAKFATDRLGSVTAARWKSSGVSSAIGTPKIRGGA